MDYNNLNNFLQNLEVKVEENNYNYKEKIRADFNIPNTSSGDPNTNSFLNDNKIKNVVLERDLRLNNNINYNVEIANPQRFNQTSIKKNPNEYNNKLNNYNFNDYTNIYKDSNLTDISENFNINTKKIANNDFNDKLSNRDKIPENASFKFTS